MPKGVTKEEVNFRLTPNNISIGLLGSPLVILEGQLYEKVDPEASAWIFKDDKRSVQFFLIKLISVHLQDRVVSKNPPLTEAMSLVLGV